MREETEVHGRAESRDPNTGEVWASFPASAPGELNHLVRATKQASRAWSDRPVRERARVLATFRRLIVDRRKTVAEVVSGETGKPTPEAFFEIFGSAEFAHYYAKLAPRLLAPRTWSSSNLAVWRKRIRLEMEPFGVIGAITPWNYPLLLAAGVVLPALVAGNGVVLKPSENTPSSAETLRDLLLESGLPADVLAVAHGAGATGAALVESEIDKIFFIGSAATGRRVAEGASRRLTPFVLELGGSDPAIVLDDAHVENAARGIAWGRFTNAGQTCVAPKRVFVVDGVYDDFLTHVRSAVERLRRGDDGDLGPLIRASQRDQLDEQVHEALQSGASIAAQMEHDTDDPTFFPPTVLVGVTPEMRVMREETFGPVLPVVRVRDEDEAVALANDSAFGLSASIWSRDIDRATALARRIEAGTVTINDSVVVALLADMPYGGVKASGTGRTHGPEGLLECVRSRSIVIDRFARFRETYWHAYTEDSRRGFDAFMVFAHGKGLFKRLIAGIRAVWLLYLKRS